MSLPWSSPRGVFRPARTQHIVNPNLRVSPERFNVAEPYDILAQSYESIFNKRKWLMIAVILLLNGALAAPSWYFVIVWRWPPVGNSTDFDQKTTSYVTELNEQFCRSLHEVNQGRITCSPFGVASKFTHNRTTSSSDKGELRWAKDNSPRSKTPSHPAVILRGQEFVVQEPGIYVIYSEVLLATITRSFEHTINVKLTSEGLICLGKDSRVRTAEHGSVRHSNLLVTSYFTPGDVVVIDVETKPLNSADFARFSIQRIGVTSLN